MSWNQYISSIKNYLWMKITFLLRILQKKNEVENIKFKKSLEYAVTGLSINQDTDAELMTVIDIDRLNFLSNSIQNLEKEK